MPALSFTPAQSEKMRACFSPRFCAALPGALEHMCRKWQLSGLELIEYYSVNCLFLCKSAIHGDCVLKLCDISSRELNAEWRTLREYGGGRFCRAFEVDFERSALLVERIKPGRLLRETEDLDERLSAFSRLVCGLNIVPADPAPFREYSGVILDLPRLASSLPASAVLRESARRAAGLMGALSENHSRKTLLHGDLHFENILLGEGGQWKIIDPHGLIGDPVFELSRQLSNEHWLTEGALGPAERRARMLYIIHFLSSRLGYSADTLKRAFYIDITLTNIWNVESGERENEQDLRLARHLLDDE